LLIQSGYAFLNFAVREQADIFGKTEIRHYKMREKKKREGGGEEGLKLTP
jgi:hypothetical protein